MTTTQNELTQWWTGLRIADKELIAKRSYPGCSAWWIALSIDEQIQLRESAEMVRAARNKAKGFA